MCVCIYIYIYIYIYTIRMQVQNTGVRVVEFDDGGRIELGFPIDRYVVHVRARMCASVCVCVCLCLCVCVHVWSASG